MTELKTEYSLLVGSEKSKSYPGTQASPPDDTQGPGCPSYSGVGKEPLSLRTDRPTLASPLDLTSLAAAIPSPAPANASAWTLVAPKKKRSRKDRRHARLGLGFRDGKRGEPERPDTGTGGVTGGREGGSEGRPLPGGGSPSADTGANPCYSAGEPACGRVSASNRNPNIIGESSPSTTTAGQTATKETAYVGGHSDPCGNQIQASTATGAGSSNTARPQTTTITASTRPTNAHNPPRTRAHPRFRRRDRGANKTADNKPDEAVPSSHPNLKRDRLDDTISPRGEHKRPRNDGHARNARSSYATITQSHLNVAVTTTPRTELTPAEANGIQGQIQKAIFAACLKPPVPGETPYAPAFDGKAFPSEGVLKMRCLDDRALNWLKAVVPTLTSPRAGMGLTVIHQSEILTKIRCGLYVPDFDGEIGQLHQVLSLQNPWYGVSRWTLFSHQATTSNPPGIFLVLGIPKEEIPTLLARGRKIAYSTGTIYIRFFTEEGLSDTPPGPYKSPEDRGEPEVDLNMEVEGSIPPRPKTPEPSVSRVLEDIEAVLSNTEVGILTSQQTSSAQNAPEATAPADKSTAQRALNG